MMLFASIIAGSYLYYHIYKVLKIGKYRKIISAGILIGFLLCVVLSRLFLGIIIHLLIALLLSDIVYLMIKKTNFKKYFQVEIIAIVIASLLTVYGVYNVNHIQYVHYDIEIDKQFEDKRILAISDIHLSTAVRYDDLMQIKEKVKERDIDMIFILGDFFDESTHENEAKKAIQFFDELTALCPVYYIVGNHDGNQGQIPIDEGLLKQIDESRIVFLKDDVINVQGINIIGRLDRTYQRKEVQSLIKGINQSEPIILLDHQPRQTKENASLGVDLQLSGHTHNGQIWPAGTLCKILHINEVEYGHINIDGMDIIVSSGMGAWGFAIKSQGNCEILEIDLKQK